MTYMLCSPVCEHVKRAVHSYDISIANGCRIAKLCVIYRVILCKSAGHEDRYNGRSVSTKSLHFRTDLCWYRVPQEPGFLTKAASALGIYTPTDV